MHYSFICTKSCRHFLIKKKSHSKKLHSKKNQLNWIGFIFLPMNIFFVQYRGLCLYKFDQKPFLNPLCVLINTVLWLFVFVFVYQSHLFNLLKQPLNLALQEAKVILVYRFVLGRSYKWLQKTKYMRNAKQYSFICNKNWN